MPDKDSLRAAAKAFRSAMPAAVRDAARRAIRDAVLRQCRELALPPGTLVAAYEPLRTEPGSVELLDGLRAAGYQVIVPRTLPDRDLDWLAWHPSASAAQPGSLPEMAGGYPSPHPLGPDAIRTARLVIVPAFAVDRAGRRLGRGGGSYDRALARIPAGTTVAALIFDEELVDWVPTDVWDQPVTAAVRPAGWLDLSGSGRGNT